MVKISTLPRVQIIRSNKMQPSFSKIPEMSIEFCLVHFAQIFPKYKLILQQSRVTKIY